MKRPLKLLQFLPLAVFVGFGRKEGWAMGFQIAALIAIAQLLILGLRRVPFSRLILGANLFLIIGGLAFAANSDPLLMALSKLMEAALFLSVFLVITVATFLTKSGAFDEVDSTQGKIRKCSYIFIGLAFICFAWSFYFRGNTTLAGTYPFIVLILANTLFKKKLFIRP